MGVGRMGTAELNSVTALVDTGTAHSIMPELLLEKHGIAPLEYGIFTIVGGSEVEYGYGMALSDIDGREFPCPVIFGADGQFLLGATTLQIFNLMVDPAEERLVTKPLRARTVLTLHKSGASGTAN